MSLSIGFPVTVQVVASPRENEIIGLIMFEACKQCDKMWMVMLAAYFIKYLGLRYECLGVLWSQCFQSESIARLLLFLSDLVKVPRQQVDCNLLQIRSNYDDRSGS